MCDHCLAHAELEEAMDEFSEAAKKYIERERLESIGVYQKKPIKVEVFRAKEAFELKVYVGEKLESIKYVNKGGLVIKGTKGELYPIDDDVFEEIYVKVSS